MNGKDALAYSDEVVSERLCAVSIVDTFLKDADSIFSPERRNEMISAMKALVPESEYAQRTLF